MFPVRILSLYNGWQILTEQKQEEWEEIEDALLSLTPDIVMQPSLILGKELGRDEFNAYAIMELYDIKLKKRGWREATITVNKGVKSNLQVSNLKNKVAVRLLSVEIMPMKDFNSYLLADAPRLTRGGICDVFVVLIPADNMSEILHIDNSSVLKTIISEEVCRAQIKELSPIRTDAPFVVVFFSHQPKELAIEELSVGGEEEFIERILEFTPEQTQAGIGILSYFSEILRQKYPDLKVKVRIEQQGSTVLMHVELPSGEIDIVKQELATYFLVAAGKENATALLNNPYHIMALENKLQLANMELRMSHQLNAQLTSDIDGLKASQQRMEESFKQQIGEQGLQIKSLIHLATQQTTSHERVQLAQIGHTSTLFKDLLGEAHGHQATQMAIHSLQHNLLSGIALIDAQDQLSSALATIKQEKPSLLGHIAGQVESAGFGAVGGFVLDWISKHAL